MSQMCKDPMKRNKFISALIQFIREYNFDGIDIDWEFPYDLTRGGSTDDPQSFVACMKDLRNAIDTEAKSSGKDVLLLSFAVPGKNINTLMEKGKVNIV